MPDRKTPRLDKLVARLTKKLDAAGPGSRAELAHLIAREAGIEHTSAKTRLSKILAGTTIPNGEDTLILLEWLDGKK